MSEKSLHSRLADVKRKTLLPFPERENNYRLNQIYHTAPTCGFKTLNVYRTHLTIALTHLKVTLQSLPVVEAAKVDVSNPNSLAARDKEGKLYLRKDRTKRLYTDAAKKDKFRFFPLMQTNKVLAELEKTLARHNNRFYDWLEAQENLHHGEEE